MKIEERIEEDASIRADSSRDEREVSRRQTLKLLGVGGIPSGLGTLPVLSETTDDSVEIVTLMEGDCVAETKIVPREWYSNTKKSRIAKKKLIDKLESFDGIHMVSRGREEVEINGFRTHNITILMSPDRSLDDIPNEVNRIPIRIERGTAPEPLNGCDDYYNDKPDPIVGGLRWDAPNGSCGTLCCLVEWYNNGSWSKYFWSARHVYTSQLCDHNDPKGNDWEQYEPTTVGTCAKAWQKYDSVLLNLNQTSRSFSAGIVNESYNVVGRVTQDGLDCFKSNDTLLKKRGINTGYQTGNITDTDASNYTCSFNDDIKGRVKTDIFGDTGDSGGPTYYEDSNGNMYMVMMTSTYLSTNNHTIGVSADHMNNQENLWFGGNPESGNC